MHLINKNKTAFSLIELIIVVALVGIISSIAMNKVSNLRGKTSNVKALVILDKLNSAVQAHDIALSPFSANINLDLTSSNDEKQIISELQYDPPDRNNLSDHKFAPGAGQPFISPEWTPKYGGQGSTILRIIWGGEKFFLNTQSDIIDVLTAGGGTNKINVENDCPGIIINFSGEDKIIN